MRRYEASTSIIGNFSSKIFVSKNNSASFSRNFRAKV